MTKKQKNTGIQPAQERQNAFVPGFNELFGPIPDQISNHFMHGTTQQHANNRPTPLPPLQALLLLSQQRQPSMTPPTTQHDMTLKSRFNHRNGS